MRIIVRYADRPIRIHCDAGARLARCKREGALGIGGVPFPVDHAHRIHLNVAPFRSISQHARTGIALRARIDEAVDGKLARRIDPVTQRIVGTALHLVDGRFLGLNPLTFDGRAVFVVLPVLPAAYPAGSMAFLHELHAQRPYAQAAARRARRFAVAHAFLPFDALDIRAINHVVALCQLAVELDLHRFDLGVFPR